MADPAGRSPFDARAKRWLRAAAAGTVSFAIGFVCSDVDRACDGVLIGAGVAGFMAGIIVGRGPRAADLCLGSAAAYFCGLFTSAAVADKLSLLPFALMFMAGFTVVFLVAAWLAQTALRSQ